MFRRKKKATQPVSPPVHVEITKSYYDMTFDEQRAFLRGLLGRMSPNEEVRKKSTEAMREWTDQGK